MLILIFERKHKKSFEKVQKQEIIYNPTGMKKTLLFQLSVSTLSVHTPIKHNAETNKIHHLSLAG